MKRVAPRVNRGGAVYGLPVSTVPSAIVKRSKDWHWGVDPTQAVRWDDPDYPEHMVEIGRLAELRYIPVGRTAGAVIPIPQKYWTDFSAKPKSQAHLVFDPDHAAQRMYICLPPDEMRKHARAYRTHTAAPLSDIARRVGGRQGTRRDYPEVRASVLGALTHVVYYTHKKGDENPGDVRSQYIHQMGEDGGICPFLAVDGEGRMWICGGSYTCPIPGITK